jgi:hypothetical protein
MVEGLKDCTAVLLRPQTIQPNGIEPLENITILAVLRQAAKLLDKALNVLEAGDDALFARRSPACLFRRLKFRQFRRQFVKVEVTHRSDLPS